MAHNHFAVVSVKGVEGRFVIIDADLRTLKEHYMTDVLTEEETRAELRRRGHSDGEIEALINKAGENPR